MRRVVITGLGLISPLASGVEKSWSRILNGDSGASLITRFDADRVATKYACEVPIGDGSDGTCLLYTSPSPRDVEESRMPSSA